MGEASVTMRIPRTVLAVIAGSALGLSGAIMQSVTRNPLADPAFWGVQFGAAFFVVIGLAWFGINQLQSYVWIAILGAGITAIFVYFISSMGYGKSTPLNSLSQVPPRRQRWSSFTVAVGTTQKRHCGRRDSWR